MSPLEGNAWAQMKAKEREQQQSNPEREPTPKPTTTRTFSGLDYDAELALPMPKPRHTRPPEEMPSPTLKPNLLTKPNVTKKRSTTDPTQPAESNSSKSEATEKKKSKVAALRSKFSLKDLGKDFRSKDIPPLSSMPKIGGSQSNELQPSYDVENQSLSRSNDDFNEAKLYVPKPKEECNVHPHSAPLFQTSSTFCDSTSMEKRSQTSISSCPDAQYPIACNEDAKTHATFKHSLVLDGSSPPARAGEYRNSGQPEFVQAQSRACSLQAESESVVPVSPQTPPPPPADTSSSSFVDPAAYSPSVYDTPDKVAETPSESSLCEINKKKTEIDNRGPFIVSSSNYRGVSRANQENQPPLPAPKVAPPFVPSKSKARDSQVQVRTPFNEGQFFSGVTSHGGYAPPPPHPDYQNTVTLEQQLAAHMDSIHFHVNTAVNKLTRTFENSNNWTRDQIMRQVDTMSDIARLINSRTVTQTEVVKELQHLMTQVQVQLNAVQQETHQTEDRMKTFVQQELGKLRGELGELIQSGPALATTITTTQTQPSGNETHPGTHAVSRAAKDGNRRGPNNKRHSRQMKRDDMPKTTDTRRPAAAVATTAVAEHSQENNKLSIPPAASKPVEEHGLGQNIPTPTAAFRTPGTDNQDSTISTPVSTKRAVWKHPGEESSGSPESKSNTKPGTPRSQQMALEESHRASLEHGPPLHRELQEKPSSAFSDDLKPPQKKGMFSFRRRRDGDNQSGNRFLRTPRRTKESKPGEQDQSPILAVPAPSRPFPVTPFSAAPNDPAIISQIQRENSPSMIHPALRNPQQRRIMQERERAREREHEQARHQAQLFPQPPRQIQAPHGLGLGQGQGQGQGQMHTLRISQSHQNFGFGTTKPSASSPTPLSPPPPHPFVAYDTSGRYIVRAGSPASFRTLRHHQSGGFINHSHGSLPSSPSYGGFIAPPPPPPPPTPTSQGQAQTQGQGHFLSQPFYSSHSGLAGLAAGPGSGSGPLPMSGPLHPMRAPPPPPALPPTSLPVSVSVSGAGAGASQAGMTMRGWFVDGYARGVGNGNGNGSGSGSGSNTNSTRNAVVNLNGVSEKSDETQNNNDERI